jgi:hypothetical protein
MKNYITLLVVALTLSNQTMANSTASLNCTEICERKSLNSTSAHSPHPAIFHKYSSVHYKSSDLLNFFFQAAALSTSASLLTFTFYKLSTLQAFQ